MDNGANITYGQEYDSSALDDLENNHIGRVRLLIELGATVGSEEMITAVVNSNQRTITSLLQYGALLTVRFKQKWREVRLQHIMILCVMTE